MEKLFFGCGMGIIQIGDDEQKHYENVFPFLFYWTFCGMDLPCGIILL